MRSEFYPRTKDKPNSLNGRCKDCSNKARWVNGRFKDETQRKKIYAANKVSYEKNKEKNLKRNNERNASNKIRALEAHGSLKCDMCGYDGHPSALEFHHRDPTTKLFNLSNAVQTTNKYSWDEILVEILKCDVICSNCHRAKHASEAYLELWNEVKLARERNEAYLGQKEDPNKGKARKRNKNARNKV